LQVSHEISRWARCKADNSRWPVIAAIVIGSLILLSFLFCVARCIFCGVELCSCCVSCFSCCCRGGGGKRNRQSKYKDDYERMPTPYQGYQHPASVPMIYGANTPMPQTATFDDPSTKRLINEDSLPYMPSWDTATKRRVEDTSEPPPDTKNGDLEMNRLGAQSHNPQPHGMSPGYNGISPGPIPPHPDYFHASGPTHGFESDVGSQRLLNESGRNSFQAVPLSPPPTYRSNSNAPSVAGDQFMAGAVDPSPHDYNRQRISPPGRQLSDPHQFQQSPPPQRQLSSPHDYHQPQNYPPHRQPSYPDSYAPSSTRYEPSHKSYDSDPNRISMPMPYNPGPAPAPVQSHAPYPPSAEASPSSYSARPPSFLQVGRRPVNGSFREV
jgi:hypothetical protein